jgi:S1-C subfamily serine protease
MLIDLLIILLAISALYRGKDIGFVRQLFSTIGFFAGLFLGAWAEPYTVRYAHTPASRALVTLLTTLGLALILLALGEYAGVRLKSRVLLKKINSYDNGLGALLGIVSLLFSIWLSAAIVNALPYPGLQQEVHSSKIITALDSHFPSAPTVIGDIGRLIDPNGFPQVFIGSEPICGGIVEGSGFVVGTDLIATNAHVVAGIKHPFVQDANGTHSATVIWFDSNLDFAVLRVSNLSGDSLVISNAHNDPGTPAAVLGYPGGGPFTASAAAILDQFTASGRNIYGKGNTNRDVYEIQANVIPGNSGGPLVATDGSVIGVVFAESTTYQHVGYALTTSQITTEINQAAAENQAVSTGKCAD